jgi:hypothetical protein
MRARLLFPVFVLSLSLTAVVSGQRTLQSDEISQIFKKVTSQPRKTWIPAGTIEATHREHREPKTTDPAVIRDEIDKQVRDYQSNADKVEVTDELQKMKLGAIPFNVRYKLANAYTMDSTVILKYDGQRFYWETNVDSRQDSIAPDPALAGNYMTEQFDLGFNRKRISAWDSQEYVTYTASGKYATVDAAGRLPRAVNGPLTAGLVPWGYGLFDYASLTGAAASATEQSIDGKSLIQMSITWQNGSSASLTLDPAKDYAVTAATLPTSKNTISVNEYGDYRLVADCWVPGTILIERHDAITNKLLGSDQWTLNAIDGTIPSPDSFAVKYEQGTFIQFISNLISEPTTYIYSDSMDMNRLLVDRLAYAAAEGRQPQNCATAAVDYVTSRLGKAVPSDTLASLVQPNGQTTLYDMKQLVQSLGLCCKAVQTDLATLQNLGPVKAILHIPGRNHFVVLDSADDRHVQIVDLSDRKFCYNDDADCFRQQWSQGLVLLVSATPIADSRPSINDARLMTILGGSGYACTKLIQTEHWYYCSDPCAGYFTYYWKRWGCEGAESGTCTNQILVRYQYETCLPDPISDCLGAGDWVYAYMLACH